MTGNEMCSLQFFNILPMDTIIIPTFCSGVGKMTFCVFDGFHIQIALDYPRKPIIRAMYVTYNRTCKLSCEATLTI